MLQLRRGVWASTLAQLRECGRGRNECVTVWTGPLDQPDVIDRAVHPAHTATPGHYAPTQEWLASFFVQLYRERRTTRGQAHTHGGRAFHSTTDDRYPLVRTAGYVSLVIPNFAMSTPAMAELCVVVMGDDGRWRETEPAAAIDFVDDE